MAAGALIAKAATKAAPALASRAESIAAMPIVAASIARPSLWAPPTTWIRTRGLRATKAAAPRGETPRAGATRATRTAIAEDREGGGRLQRRDGQPHGQPGERVGGQREERPVGAGRVDPGDAGVGGVERRRGRWVDVGVEAVDDPEPGVVDVAVDVVGEEDRGEGEAGDENDDRAPGSADRRICIRPVWRAQRSSPGSPLAGASRRAAAAAPPVPYAGGGGGTGVGSCPAPGRVGVGVVAAGRFLAQPLGFAFLPRLRLRSRRIGAAAARCPGGERAVERRPADRRLRLARIPRRGLRRWRRASARFRPGRCRRTRSCRGRWSFRSRSTAGSRPRRRSPGWAGCRRTRRR